MNTLFFFPSQGNPFGKIFVGEGFGEDEKHATQMQFKESIL